MLEQVSVELERFTSMAKKQKALLGGARTAIPPAKCWLRSMRVTRQMRKGFEVEVRYGCPGAESYSEVNRSAFVRNISEITFPGMYATPRVGLEFNFVLSGGFGLLKCLKADRTIQCNLYNKAGLLAGK